MTEAQAERLAMLLLGMAAAGAAYYILSTPPLRRATWRILRTATAAVGPWLVAEARAAWADCARAGSRGVQASSDPVSGAEMAG